MSAQALLTALGLPPAARIGQRVPKTLLVEHGAPTPADKRKILAGVNELRWEAALKPTTIGVTAFGDAEREYLEIAVLSAAMAEDASLARLDELIHRAVPYPVLLIASRGDRVTISAAHKRWSQGEAGATVLDGDVVSVDLTSDSRHAHEAAFREAMALERQPHGDLRALYQGWMDTLVALLAARVSGSFHLPGSAEDARRRRETLRECEGVDADIARLRQAAKSERQVARQVEVNLELKRAERLRAALLEEL